MTDTHAEAVIAYHERTKHHHHRYARSAGYMDWNNQPDPFRRFEGAPETRLPLLKTDPDAPHADLYRRGRIPSQPVIMETVAAFLELSMGLSAWKALGGSRWALRMNPSSGNLHPTEAHLVLPAMPGIDSGVYHYTPLRHALEKRASLGDRFWSAVHRQFGASVFFVGLTSIFWRESWKYGERAYRYCNLDAGHALAGLSMSAGLQGWRLTALTDLADDDVARLLGLNRTEWQDVEAEHPDLLCAAHPAHVSVPKGMDAETIAMVDAETFQGVPNALSRKPYSWDVIYAADRNARKPSTSEAETAFAAGPFRPSPDVSQTAAAVIRKRRSAVAYSVQGRLEKERFLAILDKTLPRNGAPFDLDLGPAGVDLLLFVHRVDGLPPGLYCFKRTDAPLSRIQTAVSTDFDWTPVEPPFPLYCLKTGDFRSQAISVSCHQEIAGDSAFSLGMIADFEEAIRRAPHFYRRRHWECGMIGQVLYLEAEAHGIRGTGIGCFFDDAVHDMLGLRDRQYQSIYHFTAGVPLEDRRLQTQPPYDHRER